MRRPISRRFPKASAFLRNAGSKVSNSARACKASSKTLFIASVFSGFMLYSCSECAKTPQEEKPAVMAVRADSLGTALERKRPKITSVKLEAKTNTVTAIIDSNFTYAYKLGDDFYLDGANAQKISYDLWCVTKIGGMDGILAIYPVAPDNKWTISADIYGPFKGDLRILPNTFCILKDSFAVMLTENGSLYTLGFQYQRRHYGERGYNPFHPFERTLNFSKYGYPGGSGEKVLDGQVTLKARESTQYGEVAELGRPGWPEKYWFYFSAPRGAMGRVMHTCKAPKGE